MTAAGTMPGGGPPHASLRRMWRAWSIYGASSILSRSIAFLLLPVYTRVLTPEEYGIRAMVALTLDLVALLVACGMKEAINRFYTAGGPDGLPRREAVSTGLIAQAMLLGAGFAVGFACAPWLAGPLLGDAAAHAYYLRLGFVSAFFLHTQEATFVYLRARGRAGTVALASLGGLLTLVGLNLLFVVVFRWGVAGIFYAEILVYGAFGVALTGRALREVGVTFVPRLARQMARFGAPVMFLPFAWLLVSRSDVMFLTHYGSLTYVGIYALSVQCAQVLQMALIYPFHNFWEPTQFELARDTAGPRVFRRMFQWFTFTAVVAAFGVALAAEDVIRVMAAPAFHGAAAVVPILVMAYVLLGVHMFFNSALLVRNRTSLAAVVALLTAAVNIGANAVLVPHFLATGAAAARVVAMIVMVATTFVLAQRLWPQRPDFAALARVTGWAMALFVVSRWWLPELPLVFALVVKGMLVATLIVLSIWSGAVDRADLLHAWLVVRARLRRRPVAEAVTPTT